MTPRDRLVRRVALLLHPPRLVVLSDVEAADRLRPNGQGVQGAPIIRPSEGSTDGEDEVPRARERRL